MSKEEDNQSPPFDDAPDHLSLINMRAKSYQMQIAKLKAGARSGISHTFGAAEDLLSDPVEIPEIAKFDQTSVDPGVKERQLRAIFLTRQVIAICAALLKNHIDTSRRGDFGTEIEKKSLSRGIGNAFDPALKELSCVWLYLIALEQGVMEEDVAPWFKEFFGTCMAAANNMLQGPPVPQIMQGYETYDPNKLCQKAASAVSRHLGFGEVGDRAWNDLRKRCLCAGPERLDLLTKALKTELSEVEKQLSQ
jgi:hypothetical protein